MFTRGFGLPTKTPAQVEKELEGILRDWRVADPLYDAIDGTSGGKVLNADAARLLSPDYQSIEDCIAFTKATYPPCSKYIFERLMKELRARSPQSSRWQRRFLLMAGGASSGKTSSIGGRILAESELVYDSNLADFWKAKAIIDAALARGWNVSLRYVHRDFTAAMDGMIERAVNTGRYIPLTDNDPSSLANLHFNSQQAFLRLVQEYDDISRVEIAALENNWKRGSGDVVELRIDALANNAKYRYYSLDALYALQRKKVDELRSSEIRKDLISVLS